MKAIVLLLGTLLAVAAGPSAAAGLDNVLEQLGVDTPPEALAPAPIPGFLEVARGTQVLYVSSDGKLVINGDILSLDSETNLTEMRRGAIRREMLRAVPADARVALPAIGPKLARVIVFTDMDCPYCALLHRQHEALQRHGIEIHYLFYPRSGPDSASFDQAVAVWCSKDSLAALDSALDGNTLPQTDCPNPVLQHYELARELELKGTPAVITADGTVRYGLHRPEEILRIVRVD